MKTLTLTPDAAQLLAQLLRMHQGALSWHFRWRFFRPARRVMADDVHYAKQMEMVKLLLAQLQEDPK